MIEVSPDFVVWIDRFGLQRKDAILTWDHFIPKCKGGGEGSNLVPSCYNCNQEKADQVLKPIEEDTTENGFWICWEKK